MQNYITRADRLAGILVWIAAMASVTILLFAIASCAGPRTMQAEAELQAMQDAAMSDGVLTPEEGEALTKKIDSVEATRAEESSDMPALIGSSVATLLAALGLVRYMRGPSTKAAK